MKQLTMTKVLTPLAALAFAFGVQAATVSDGFETETSTVVTNRTGWSFTYGTDGADDASAITAYPDAASKPQNFSEAFATAGDNYLKLSTEDGTLFRNLSDETASRTVDTAGLFVDTDVQFTVTDASDSPTNTVSADDKLVIWLEANGATTNLCVLGHSFGSSISDRADKVYTLVTDAGQTPSIVPGDWYRLTVKAVSSFSLAGETVTYPAFQVYLDGVPLKANEYIGDATALSINQINGYQPYIPARTDTMTSLTKVGFSGEGALDNIAISEDIPDFLPRQKVTVSWDTSIINAVTLRHGNGLTTLTSSPGVVIVDSVTDITIANNGTDIDFVGSSSYDFTDPSGWTKSDVTLSLSEDGKTLTCAAGNVQNGSFTIGVEANNTCTLTLSANDDSGLSSVSYTITSGGVTSEPVTISGDDLGELVLGGAAIDCLFGDVITFTVVPVSGKTATLSATSGGSFSGNAFTVASDAHTAAVSITIDSAKATIDGVGYTSFADAFNAAKAAGTAKTVVLADNATSVAATVENGNEITIDLAGNTITGADGSAVFTVAAGGTLTITNSTVAVGQVDADTGDPCISNAGTLNLQAGKFSGAITGGTINVTGGAYTAIPADATVNYPTGQELVVDTEEVSAYVYKLGNATYTVTYYDINDDEITESGTTYTYGTGLGSLASAPVVTGKTFGGWYATSARNGDAVTSIGAAETGAKAFYAKYTDNTYTIKFVYGLNGETTNTQSLAYNTVPTAPDASYVNVAGYTWDWDVAPVAATADATYTAVYTPIEYTVLFISGEGTTTTQTIVKTYGQTILAEEVSAAASVSGKNFTAWDPVPSFPITVTADATYTAQYEAAGGSDWSDTPAEIPAETSAATQYPALKDSALATADAKELTVWAKAKGVAFSDIAADATGTYVDAFLLNCTTEQVAAEKAAFKLNITVGAGGAITVTLPDGKIYNGDLQMKGSNDLSTWTDVNAASSSYKFYKYSLGL